MTRKLQDAERIAHSTRALRDQNISELARLRTAYSSHAYAAQAGDPQSHSVAKSTLAKIKALEETIAEQESVIQGAEAAANAIRDENADAGRQEALSRAVGLFEGRIDRARRIEKLLAEIAALGREYDAMGHGALATAAPYLGGDACAVIAPKSGAQFIVSRLIALADWHQAPGIEAPFHDVNSIEPLDEISREECERMRLRSPAHQRKAV